MKEKRTLDKIGEQETRHTITKSGKSAPQKYREAGARHQSVFLWAKNSTFRG